MEHPPDLARYFERIALEPEPEPTLAFLRRLQQAHLAAIPFENLDVRLGRRIALELPALEEKLVRRRRGGYCFEQNTLFAAVLGALGFAVERLEARVRPPGSSALLPRTHLVLRVRVAEGQHLADVGFGGDGPLLPVPLDGTPIEAGGDRHRVVHEDGGALVLQRHLEGAWVDLFAALPTPVHPVDVEVANHFTSTHPESVFVRTLTAQRSSTEARHVLRGRTYGVRRGSALETRELGPDEAAELLVSVFGLDVTRDEARRALGA